MEEDVDVDVEIPVEGVDGGKVALEVSVDEVVKEVAVREKVVENAELRSPLGPGTAETDWLIPVVVGRIP